MRSDWKEGGEGGNWRRVKYTQGGERGKANAREGEVKGYD